MDFLLHVVTMPILEFSDKDPSRSSNTLTETVNESDFIFISVPTPANKKGENDLSILINALDEINSINKNANNIILVRSTVVPGTTEDLQNRFPNLRLVFNPEFLTERSAVFDFINQSRVILGVLKNIQIKLQNFIMIDLVVICPF